MDSERPIEKLLRLAAKKRQDQHQGQFELHPATRRLLQGEVARQFGRHSAAAGSFAGVIARIWPRLALGAAILVALCAITWVSLPSKRPAGTIAFRKEQTLGRT